MKRDEEGKFIITTIIRGNEEKEILDTKEDCLSWLNAQTITLETPNSAPSGHEMSKEEMQEVASCYKNIIQKLDSYCV